MPTMDLSLRCSNSLGNASTDASNAPRIPVTQKTVEWTHASALLYRRTVRFVHNISIAVST